MSDGQTDYVKGNLCSNCHTDTQTKEDEWTFRFKLNLRIAHEIHGFNNGNPHKSEDFIVDFKDFVDLMKYEDLWINLWI